jgi:cell wall-associated NlpC family hydrolase
LRILATFAVLFLVACAPLRPLAPPQQKSVSWAGSQNASQNITGISAWDNVLNPWLGAPYLAGGSTKKGTDCSGFVGSVYREKEGVSLPRTTTEGFKNGKSVDKNSLAIGDLVYFGERGYVDHVGLFVGNGNFIHASTSQGVMISPLEDNYWKPKYMGARRHL